MKSLLSVVLALAAIAGCASGPRKDAPSSRSKEGGKPRDLAWRLVEKEYGSIDDPWAGALDAQLPEEALALVYERLPREGRKELVRTSPSRSSAVCAHAARLEIDEPSTANVGAPVRATVWVDGPEGVAHVLEIRGSHAGVEVLSIDGAAPLAEEPGRVLLEAGARARVTFTSRYEGRGGLVLAITNEIFAEGARPRLARANLRR